MANYFSGQYLGEFEKDGTKGHLTINIDSDRSGTGIAYISTIGGPHYVLLCTDTTYEEGVIHGFAKRIPQMEAFHQHDNDKNNEDEQFEFALDTKDVVNSLTYSATATAPGSLQLRQISLPTLTTGEFISSWSEFKSWADKTRASDRNGIFRGIPRRQIGLRTSFHRTHRVDLERYRDRDIPAFRDLAETVGGLNFSNIPEDIGALWGFAQHHGFQTPLLDWTESPYIAAYFSFSERIANQDADDREPVRIYCLNGAFVENNRPEVVNMADTYPRVWIFKPNSKGNQRLVFQQGLFLHSNIVEIESYLLNLSHGRTSPLKAIDMPAKIAREVIDDLAFMGVSHLSLFPGLDGAARHATLRQFYGPPKT
jgi:hypothetical protein